MRKLSGQFMNGVSYMTGRGAGAAKAVSHKVASKGVNGSQGKRSSRTRSQSITYAQPQSTAKSGGVKITKIPANKQVKTGTTYEAPKPTARAREYTKGTEPKRSTKEETSR